MAMVFYFVSNAAIQCEGVELYSAKTKYPERQERHIKDRKATPAVASLKAKQYLLYSDMIKMHSVLLKSGPASSRGNFITSILTIDPGNVAADNWKPLQACYSVRNLIDF